MVLEGEPYSLRYIYCNTYSHKYVKYKEADLKGSKVGVQTHALLKIRKDHLSPNLPSETLYLIHSMYVLLFIALRVGLG